MSFCLILRVTALCAAASLAAGAAAPRKPKALSSFDPQVKEVLAKMTLEEKIGQMMQPDQASVKSIEDISKYAFSGRC